jgi:hypothetical protein
VKAEKRRITVQLTSKMLPLLQGNKKCFGKAQNRFVFILTSGKILLQEIYSPFSPTLRAGWRSVWMEPWSGHVSLFHRIWKPWQRESARNSGCLFGNVRPITQRIFYDDLQLYPCKIWMLQEITCRDQQYIYIMYLKNVSVSVVPSD